MIARLALTLRTVRHLRAVQVIDRLTRRMPRRDHADADAVLRLPPQSLVRPIAAAPSLRGPDLFRLHGIEVDIGDAACWTRRDLPGLLLYHLHYFDDLCAADAPDRHAWHRALVSRWIAENPRGSSPAWDPYTTSLRVVNWLCWASTAADLPAGFADSLRVQLLHLERRLERHLLANHLFENAKALWFGGACMAGRAASRWLATGMQLVESEVREQVLADGGHFELSPMYHSRILEDILDLVHLELASRRSPPEFLVEAAHRMLDWLAAVTHPDGTYALFNDAALDQSFSLAELERYGRACGIERGGAVGTRLLEPSGYARVARGPWLLLADVAPIAVDYQPAHGHADALTFELSVDARRLVVDAGTSTYEPGPQRAFERSTRAHNTVCIGERDSSEVWGGFRVGRRARIIERRMDASTQSVCVTAAHDGYVRSGAGILHRRTWQVANDRLVVVDELEGRGVHPVASRFRFAPDVRLERAGTAVFEARCGAERAVALHVDPGLEWAVTAGTYHPRFGASESCNVLEGKGRVGCPARIEVSFVR
jgi:uncharacterized heparinase superfamily protein